MDRALSHARICGMLGALWNKACILPWIFGIWSSPTSSPSMSNWTRKRKCALLSEH